MRAPCHLTLAMAALSFIISMHIGVSIPEEHSDSVYIRGQKISSFFGDTYHKEPQELTAANPDIIPVYTRTPSQSPSAVPSNAPSDAPSSMPSSAPSESCTTNENGLFGDDSTGSASEVTFKYEVETDSNIAVDTTLITLKIEETLNNELIPLMFDACASTRRYGRELDSPHYMGRRLKLVALSSRPPDNPLTNENCTLISNTQNDCTPVEGKLTLYDDSTSSNEEVTVLGHIKTLMDNDSLVNADIAIKKITFIEENEILSSQGDSAGTASVQIQSTNPDGSSFPYLPVGLGSASLVVFIAAALGYRRYKKKKKETYSTLFVSDYKGSDGGSTLNSGGNGSKGIFQRNTLAAYYRGTMRERDYVTTDRDSVTSTESDDFAPMFPIGAGPTDDDDDSNAFLRTTPVVTEQADTESESGFELLFNYLTMRGNATGDS